MFSNLRELVTSMPTEQDCRNFFAKQRWPDGKAYCPHCGSGKVYTIQGGKRYECGEKLCLKRFSVTSGTIFHDSKIGLTKWFMAVYLCSNSKKGISSYQLASHIGVTQKTSWFMLHRIRKINEIMGGAMFEGLTQTDEKYYGGAEKNRHTSKKNSKEKVPVLGMLNKKDGIVTKVLPEVSKEIVISAIESNIVKGSTIVTDALHLYRSLSETYQHKIVNHTAGEFKNKQGYTTNGVENFWSLLSRSIVGIHHWVSAKHLQKYCDNTAFKYNTRLLKDADRFTLVLSKAECRLPYKVLIGKNVSLVHGESEIQKES